MSVGSRQTRRKRRARRRQAELRELASTVLRKSTRTVLNMLIALVHGLNRGAARDSLLFVALLGSSAAAVASVFAGHSGVAILFCLLTLLLCAAIWIGKTA